MGKILLNHPLITTSPYGQRGNSFHGGIDLTGYDNGIHVLDYICAKEAGKVVAVRNNCTGFESGGSYGNYIKISHGNGIETLYAHMAYGSVKHSVGDTVGEGEVIGYMGNTGTSYGGHLHFEVRENGTRIDPTDYAYGKELPGKIEEPKKSVEELANEVIQGLWGNNPERKERLEAAGYDYSAVQTRVNEILAPAPTPKPEEPIREGDIVVVNGIGTASSNGTGARTRLYSNHTMKVIAIASGAQNAYALNQYATGNVKDYSKVTAWFNKSSIKRG